MLALLPACRWGFTEKVYEDACLPVSCTGNELVDCIGARTICAQGCATTAPPHCLALAPSNGVTIDLLAGAEASLTGTNLIFDTTDGTISGVRDAGTGVRAGIGFFVVDEMGVFVVGDAMLPSGSTWTAHGSNAFVLYAASTISVMGTLDAGAIGDVGGPHATRGGSGDLRTSCEGQNGPYKFSLPAGAGGGGGGGATAGGKGADTAADMQGATSGGSGGTTCMQQPTTTPLRGGNGGGPGGTENMVVMGGTGGGGGGAVALVAMTSIIVNGAVTAPGEGGTTIASGSGGGGGGAGGAVFLESLTVTVNGALTANGGGGGPAINATMAAVHGQRGHVADVQPALGAANAGNGGTRTTAPTGGQTATGGGGGGGAIGTIEIRALGASTAGAITSPAPRMSQPDLE